MARIAQIKHWSLSGLGSRPLLLTALVATLAACTSAPPTPTETTPTPTTGSPAPTATLATVPLQVYWIQEEANSVSLRPVKVQVNLASAAASPTDQLKAGVERLLQGPANSSMSSSIPTNTKLNSLKIEPDGVHLDLSREFISGGGSASMQGRLGQIVYTASTLDPKVKVWISVAGEPLQVLGGEGLEVPQPITREQFDQEFKF